MTHVARRVGPNLFEVERSSGFWLWRRTWVAQAYWFEDPTGLFGSWYWVDGDVEIQDPDVRIALSEADTAWKRRQEEAVWKKK